MFQYLIVWKVKRNRNGPVLQGTIYVCDDCITFCLFSKILTEYQVLRLLRIHLFRLMHYFQAQRILLVRFLRHLFQVLALYKFLPGRLLLNCIVFHLTGFHSCSFLFQQHNILWYMGCYHHRIRRFRKGFPGNVFSSLLFWQFANCKMVFKHIKKFLVRKIIAEFVGKFLKFLLAFKKLFFSVMAFDCAVVSEIPVNNSLNMVLFSAWIFLFHTTLFSFIVLQVSATILLIAFWVSFTFFISGRPLFLLSSLYLLCISSSKSFL